MPAILRNSDAESLLLDIRAGCTAASLEVGDRAGAFLTFPTSVVIRGRPGSQLVFPLRSDAEPGTVVASAGSAEVWGLVGGIAVRGRFHWAFDDTSPPPAEYRFGSRGRDLPPPPWATQLPGSQRLSTSQPAGLARQQVHLRRRARDSEHRLLALTEGVIRRSACHAAIRHTLRYRPVTDEDDLVQRGLLVAWRLLPLYASSSRPPCSWLGMIRLDGRRDMHREVSRLDWLPTDASAALTLADACGITRQGDPTATLAAVVEAAVRLGKALPRITPEQLDVALRAPTLLAREQEAAAVMPGPETAHDHDADRSVVETVAGLVTEDARVVASAVAGDPEALRHVGDAVVRIVRERRERTPATRRRCWELFQRSGELFTAPAALEHLGADADRALLAAVDERLRRASGIAR